MLTITAYRLLNLVAAIAQRSIVTIVYRKPNGVLQLRPIRPVSIETCANGNTIVRALCVLAEDRGEDACRSFTLADIEDAVPGNIVANGATITLED